MARLRPTHRRLWGDKPALPDPNGEAHAGEVRRAPGVCISHGMARRYAESSGTPSCPTPPPPPPRPVLWALRAAPKFEIQIQTVLHPPLWTSPLPHPPHSFATKAQSPTHGGGGGAAAPHWYAERSGATGSTGAGQNQGDKMPPAHCTRRRGVSRNEWGQDFVCRHGTEPDHGDEAAHVGRRTTARVTLNIRFPTIYTLTGSSYEPGPARTPVYGVLAQGRAAPGLRGAHGTRPDPAPAPSLGGLGHHSLTYLHTASPVGGAGVKVAGLKA